MNLIFIFTAVVVVVFIAVFGILLSHRIAGPLYRLHRHMSEIGQGKIQSEVSFRKGDYFQELAGSFNEQLRFFKDSSSKR